MIKPFILKILLINSVFLLLLTKSVDCRINVKIANLQCSSLDEKILEFSNCKLKAVRRDVAEITIYVKLFLKPINNTMVNISIKRRGDYKRRHLYQARIDVCEFLRTTRRNFLAETLYKFFELLKYSNVNHTCPYDHDVILSNGRIDTRPLSFLSMASGEYTISTTWYVYDIPAAQVNTSIHIY